MGAISRQTSESLRPPLSDNKQEEYATLDLMRFAPPGRERSVEDQINTLSSTERACLRLIKKRWQENNAAGFTEQMYLRFARSSPVHPFHVKATLKAMSKYSRRYDALSASLLEKQLRSKYAFPVPGLVTKDGCEVVYMRASRYVEKTTPIDAAIDNVVYAMNTLVCREEPCKRGIAVVVNMADWSMQNVSLLLC
jgi:hypothetical protein